MKRSLVGLLVVAASWPLAGQDDKPQSQGRPFRVMANGAWEVVRKIGFDSDVLLNPAYLATAGDRIVVLDRGDMLLKSFRVDGRMEWKVGGLGKGPGEMTEPRSLALDSAGNTIVFDPGNGRVTLYDRAGKFARSVPLGVARGRVAPGERWFEVLVLNPASDSLSIVADSIGSTAVTARLTSELERFDGLSREPESVLSTGRGHLLTFRWSSRILLLDRRGVVVRSCSAIDSLGFPSVRRTSMRIAGSAARVTRVEPNAREAGLAAALVGNRLAVLHEDARGRATLDLYRPECGRYLESRPFSFPVTRIAGIGDLLIALVVEPTPHIAILRWVSK